jgi:hypothetical protein
MTLEIVQFADFTCRLNPSNCPALRFSNHSFQSNLWNISAACLGKMQGEVRWTQIKREDRGPARPPKHSEFHSLGSRKESGGLGSSHTTPCGAAVPARPPTRSSETTRPT